MTKTALDAPAPWWRRLLERQGKQPGGARDAGKDHVDELAALKQELERSREAFRSLIDSTEDSIYLVDRDGRYQLVNRHHAARLGRPVDALVGQSYGEFHTAEKTAEFADIIAKVICAGASARQEHWSARDARWFLRTFSPVRDRGGATVAVTVVSKDITDLKRLEGRLQELSTTDTLTGIRNRRGFEALAADRMKVAAREGHGVTLLYADLDDLKQINDAFGHPAGDRAIRDAALLLTEACRGSDVVARVGGDEFVVLLSGAAAAGAERIIGRIREVLARYNASAPAEARLSLSIGVGACLPGETCSVAELILRADRAMYASKAERRSTEQPPRP
jgi:diguanylate cyclase (GGDEF)-like protein/PAS domain S-box-containing protein